MTRRVIRCAAALTMLLISLATSASADEVKVLKRAADPYGAPRPAPGQKHVPLRATIYLELGLSEKDSTDAVLPGSVTIELQAEGEATFAVLKPKRQFVEGYTGRFPPSGKKSVLAVYADPVRPLRPATTYTIRVAARSRDGATLPAEAGTWRFTTETEVKPRPVAFTLALADPPVRWHGGFFTGICNVAFCSSAKFRIPTYELMEEVRKTSPRAWSLQRDFWLTGLLHEPKDQLHALPNIVRERETRHITAIDGQLLHAEDFFGHAQYGIPANRPLSADYHPGDEILVSDGSYSSRAKVVRADDDKRTVLVTGLTSPKEGWKLAYAAPLPTKEDPKMPGLFAVGGCYLRKLRPHGTPTYYWGRLDAEWDLSHKRFGRRLLPNFTDAPGELSIDGRAWTYPKDYAEWHEVVRTISDHIIDRYGDAALTFPWSVLNEPDLGLFFWRSGNWDELQKFYDYTADAILRAFEERGYDSAKVFIGGLELGGIFGTHLKLQEFLSHCSPKAEKAKGALPLNAAFTDTRLKGKRSKRVEALCKANDGRGSPCDFISIHAYNRAHMMADKLATAKQVALQIDPAYYAKLWVNSHESTPGWAPPPDPAYRDSFLGNGYYPTWCAEVARRQLQRAANDPRYGFGESILTVWPWPNPSFGGGNDTVRAFPVEGGKTITVAMPILHFLGLLARMGPTYHVLPEQTIGGNVVSGFISREGKTVRVLLYAHNAADTESRSDAAFDVALRLTGLPVSKGTVRQYRFDKDHNSYFRLADDTARKSKTYPAALVERVKKLSALHQTGVSAYTVGAAGDATITARVAGNGACFLILEPADAP